MVQAGDDFVYFCGDLVVVQEGVVEPERQYEGRTPPQYVLPIPESSAHLFGRTLRINHNGTPWMEVDDVVDLAVA